MPRQDLKTIHETHHTPQVKFLTPTTNDQGKTDQILILGHHCQLVLAMSELNQSLRFHVHFYKIFSYPNEEAADTHQSCVLAIFLYSFVSSMHSHFQHSVFFNSKYSSNLGLLSSVLYGPRCHPSLILLNKIK